MNTTMYSGMINILHLPCIAERLDADRRYFATGRLEAFMPHINLKAAAAGATGRLNRADAAAYLGLAVSTLADWHRKGLGPKSVKVGGRRFYRLDALNAYINEG